MGEETHSAGGNTRKTLAIATISVLALVLVCAVAFGRSSNVPDELVSVQTPSNEKSFHDDNFPLPTDPEMKAIAPDVFNVVFETNVGNVVLEIIRADAPNGVDRFYNLVRLGYYDGCRFFRVVPKFVIQFGIHGNPKVNDVWQNADINDDPVKEHNTGGTICFATAGPDTRTTQVFVNMADNEFLDKQGFAAFGSVTQGRDIMHKIDSEYGEKPNQDLIQSEGNAYLEKSFPHLSYVKKAFVHIPSHLLKGTA
eukprot:JP446640.1.p2 GENE.JP446640.1~~JP446640.1.p2  ORF type:complete len:269 (-),score=96.09 JP446640.1:149-907(-)